MSSTISLERPSVYPNGSYLLSISKKDLQVSGVVSKIDRRTRARARLYCENLIDRKADNSNLTKLPRNRGTSSLPANHHRRTPLSPSRFRYPLSRRRRLGYVSHPDLFLPSSRAVDVPTTPVPRDLSLSIRPLPPRMFLRSAWQAARERERACERRAHKWKTD